MDRDNDTTAAPVAANATTYEESGKFGLALLAPCIYPCFRTYHLTVNADHIWFKYGPLLGIGVNVKLTDIKPESVKTGRYSCADNLYYFGGFGVRYSLCLLAWGYNMKTSGDYVRFETIHGTRYHLACKDGEAIVKVLQRNLGKEHSKTGNEADA